ncbi:MAG: CDP-glycerol glycerophosphotransferase family protein, partial [Clostridia bacterium]|nr:CDP-glycerol glycerophosphotransferase family protein [Clostridia bacterium]
RSTSNFTRFSLFLPGFLIKYDLVKERKFSEKAPEDADILFLIQCLFDGKDYQLTGIPLNCTEPFENDFYNYRRQYEKEWYTDALLKTYLPYMKKHPKSQFVKTLMTYIIEIRFACNRNERSKNILLDKDLEDYFDAMRRLMAYIDDSILASYNLNKMTILPKYFGLNMVRIKKNDPKLYPKIAVDNSHNYAAVIDTALVDVSTTLKATIFCMDYDPKKKELIIDGRLNNVFIFPPEKIKCLATCGKVTREVTPTSIYSLEKYFGISMHREYTFQVRFGAKELAGAVGKGITFQFRYGLLRRPLDLVFPRLQSRLVAEFPHSYWMFSKYIMTYNSDKKALWLQNRSSSAAWKLERQLYKDFKANAGSAQELARAKKSIKLRMLYWLTRPLYRKRPVWLTFDQLFKGGDNGEYFFRHVSENHGKDVDIYYVVNKDCEDYERLKKGHKHILPFNSIKEKLTVLHTQCVFATRVDVKQYCGFGVQLEKYFRGLLTYDVFCLQHGLTIQRIAQFQNRLFDDTKLYFCVSPNEIENLKHPVYGYDKSTLLLTGAPRYDGLVSDDKKQILISPTWRRNVTAGTNKKGHRHEYSINFKDTEYYRIYNGLINNKKLLDCARETGYRIVYLVHPILSPQKGDFTAPPEVSIVAGADNDVSYERMMCESSLMLTDHSGVQFDFAYMRKPLVYYHPDTLPPQYDAGGMDYETQAFGPVCRNEDEVVDALCRAMRNQCRMEDMYRARADKFFAFDDRNNCERIYKAAQKKLGKKV